MFAMRHLSSLVTSSAFAAAVAFFSSSAAAHIELVEPSPRYALPSNKSCPCGDGDSNRRCMVTAAESTDPNRSTKVSTFEAGSTITVVVEEYIDHAGRIRVAFDDDGADLADFNLPANILEDVADPSESGLSEANPRVWELEVQLPNMTCDNCTLQVIQAMHGDTVNPVMDPAPLSTYYTCADIRLVAAGSLGEGEGEGSGGSANVGEAGGPSASGSGGAAPAGGSGGGATGGTTSVGGGGAAAVEDADEDEEEDSGCAFRASESSTAAGWALALLGLAAAVRRRTR
jgi:MYXO-CTERM domain-containing protein